MERRQGWTARAVAGFAAATVLAFAATAPGAQGEGATFGPGFAKATAVAGKVGPGVGNLELAVRGGVAVTQVTNQLAQATSQTADLGLIGGTLTGGNCRGGEASITPDDLPQPTAVDNRKGDASATRDESESTGSPFGLGRMEVSATKSPPSSVASTTIAGLSVSPLLQLGGGTALARTTVLPNEGREAESIVTGSVDLGGAVRLDGLRWRAFHRTGAEPLAEAGFDIGRAAVGGVPFPVEDAQAIEAAANTALAPSGLSIRMPKPQRLTAPADLIRITPLQIELRDSPLGGTVLGPGLGASREGRSQLFEGLSAVLCDLAGALLVADIAVSVAAGSGFLTLEVGGAEAATSNFDQSNPFGDDEGPILEVPRPDAGVPALDGDRSLGALGQADGLVGASVEPDLAAPVSGDSSGVLASSSAPKGPFEELCASLHANRGACRDGYALPLGLLAVLAVLAVAGVDVFRQRRAGEVAT